MTNINSVIAAIKRGAGRYARGRASTGPGDVNFKGDLIGISTKGTRRLKYRAYFLDWIVSDPESRGKILMGLADSAVRGLRRAVEPISRTGRMRNSFKGRMSTPYSSEVYTDAIHASGILDSLKGTSPPAQAIVSWMDSPGVYGFSGMDESEKLGVAFAIRASIKTGAGLGRTGRSVLLRLPPSGQLRFNYVTEAGRQLEAEAKEVGLRLARIF